MPGKTDRFLPDPFFKAAVARKDICAMVDLVCAKALGHQDRPLTETYTIRHSSRKKDTRCIPPPVVTTWDWARS